MSTKVNQTPILPRPSGNSVASLASFDADLVRGLFSELSAHAYRLNMAVTTDGEDRMLRPLRFASYSAASLPSATQWVGGLIFVPDETDGPTLAFSDGTDWRRLRDSVEIGRAHV